MSVLHETTISLPDLAAKLGKTYGTVHRWTKTPGPAGIPLEALKVGATWYTSLEAVDRYSGQQQAEPQRLRDPEAERILAMLGVRPKRLRAGANTTSPFCCTQRVGLVRVNGGEFPVAPVLKGSETWLRTRPPLKVA